METWSNRALAVLIFTSLFVIYNLNGREIGTVDSQPAKFAAVEIALAGTVVLDRIVAERPGLAERPAFARDREGHYRSAHPILPALAAGVVATTLHWTGLVDARAPLAPNLVAAVTASALTAAACALVAVAVRRLVPTGVAIVTSLALGLGTNYWAAASQTLWQHETVAFGTALALWAWLRPDEELTRASLLTGGLGLALSGAARPQTAVLVGVLLGWIVARAGWRAAAMPAAIVALAAVAVIGANVHWFGHPLGAVPRLEAVHPEVHGVPGPIAEAPWWNAVGLLVSPSRGLLVFSPIVLVALAGLRRAGTIEIRAGWLHAAVALQFVAYACYAVWWAGHTYGPRYLLDILVPLTPAAALGAVEISRVLAGSIAGGILLAWSITVAGAGAFIYPNEGWNTRPLEVDRHHERLWQVRDSQIPRTLWSEPSPQNFDLFAREAIRQP